MFCTNCGCQIDDRAVICVHCGVPVKNTFAAATVPQPTIQPKKVNGVGIAGFVLGILSIWLGMFFCITPIISLILSIIGTAKIKKCNSANGLAIAGLVLSILFLLFWLLVWIIVLVGISSGAVY